MMMMTVMMVMMRMMVRGGGRISLFGALGALAHQCGYAVVFSSAFWFLVDRTNRLQVALSRLATCQQRSRGSILQL